MGLDDELFFAVQIRYIDKVQELLEKGANPNVKQGSLSALHMVAIADESICAGILELPLEHGADPNIRDNDYLTPLEIAKMRNDARTARIIEEYSKQR